MEDAKRKVRGLKFQLSYRVLDFPKMRGKKNEGSNLSSRRECLIFLIMEEKRCLAIHSPISFNSIYFNFKYRLCC